jgi:endoglucanase
MPVTRAVEPPRGTVSAQPCGTAARVPRRAFLALPALPALLARPALAGSVFAREWSAFAERFLTAEGRVVDTGNAGISHSEGQGWGLMFSAAAGDRRSFDQILDFTRTAMRRPGDALHSWRWNPATTPHVSDPNNATDGDLYISLGLARGAAIWREPALAEAARPIARDILRLLRREIGGLSLLLPGAAGFEHPDRLVFNPSYAVFEAWRTLRTLLPDPAWARLETDHLTLLRTARFGARALPPDWVELRRADGTPGLPAQWPPRFSFDAVRVPLLLAWGGHAAHPAARAAVAFWSSPGSAFVPAWADLRDGTLAHFAASAGVVSVHRLVVAMQQGAVRFTPVPGPAEEDYYSAALRLLVLLVATERGIAAG